LVFAPEGRWCVAWGASPRETDVIGTFCAPERRCRARIALAPAPNIAPPGHKIVLF
jgi:hypothetical protein